MKAIKITPSSPIILAKGSKKSARCLRILIPPMSVFAKTHITRPAGAATAMALLRTNRVLSKIERIMTSETFGGL